MVRIDLPEEGDTADFGGVREDDGRDAPAALPEAPDQAAYHAEYRAAVEVEYREFRAAPGSWDAEVPRLRRTWAELEEKIPLPERSRHSPEPDTLGAWRGDGDRYLTPETNAEVDRGCGRIRDIGENLIAPAIRSIEAEDPDRELIGFEHRLKGADRIKEKVASTLEEQPGLSPRQALSMVPDAVRFTYCYPEEKYSAGVRADLDRLASRNFNLTKPLKNSWDSDQYKGINTQWREPETGQLFEVQFHTRASFEAKQLTHVAYERIRSPLATDADVDELQDYQRLVCSMIPAPPGAAEIHQDVRKERGG